MFPARNFWNRQSKRKKAIHSIHSTCLDGRPIRIVEKFRTVGRFEKESVVSAA